MPRPKKPYRIRQMDVAELVPAPYNPRTISPEAMAGLEASIARWGCLQPLVWNRRTERLVAGHQRLEALRSQGIDRIEVAVVDLPADEEKALNVALNNPHIAGDWRWDALGPLLDDIDAIADLDPALLGFDPLRDEVDAALAALADEPTDGLTDPDAVPEPPAEPVTRPGDLWLLGPHRLLCGDSTKPDDVARLLDGGTPRAVVFDPPFDGADEVLAWREECDDALVFTDPLHLLECVEGWPPFRCQFVWDCQSCWYTPSWPLARVKLCLWFGISAYREDGMFLPRKPGRVDLSPREVWNTRSRYVYHPDPRGLRLATLYGASINREFSGHPHSKPVLWIAAMLANCTAGEVIDPFVGGGPTLIACEQLGRRCFGMEIEPRYCDVAVRRWEQFTGQRATRKKCRPRPKLRAAGETR